MIDYYRDIQKWSYDRGGLHFQVATFISFVDRRACQKKGSRHIHVAPQPWPVNYDARLPGVRSQVRASFCSPLAGWHGCYTNVRRCQGMSMVLQQQKDPLLELFEKSRKFLSSPKFPPRRGMTYAVESEVKKILPSFLLRQSW